jgi:hypothetical protein
LANRVNEFYASWSPLDPEQDLRLYAGGWVAGNFVVPTALAYLYTALVYYPQTIIHDPVADWFYPRRTHCKRRLACGVVEGACGLDWLVDTTAEPSRCIGGPDPVATESCTG